MSRNPLSTLQRNVVLLGASGLIGSVLEQKLGRDASLRTVRWTDDPQLPETLAQSFDGAAKTDVILACGVTDPKLPEATIRYSNTEFPQKLITACRQLPGVRFITLGTVMEHFPEACAANSYLKSKLDLGRWIAEQNAKPEGAGRFRHLRLHTVYGGGRQHVKPHMFLGQILAAVEAGAEFKMSAGDQLREYHHVDDIAEAIRHIDSADWTANDATVIGIHSGNPVRLADLATGVFAALGRRELLKIGSLPRPAGENLAHTFERSPPEILPNTREPIAGVVQWLKEILGDRPR